MTIDEYKVYFEMLKKEEFDLAAKFRSNTVPDSLYKYYSLDSDVDRNKSKLDYLERQLIFLSKLKNFNDPFEGSYLVFNKEKLEEKGWDIDLIDEYYNTLVNFWNITCLSDTNEQNMPMWAYYANSHQGFCVEYQFSELQKKYIYNVNYEDYRQQANSIITNTINNTFLLKEGSYKPLENDHVMNQMLFLSITAKHTSWKHENEYRVISPETNFPATAKNIYIGLNCEEQYKKRLIEIGNKFKGYCNVYQMQIVRHNENFALQRKQMI